MTVHVQRLSNRNLNLVVRVYTGVPDDAPAYHHRLNFDGVCVATVKPNSSIAWVMAYKGSVGYKDLFDVAEALHKETRVTEMMYERAKGYVVHLVRVGKKKWKRKPVKSENVVVLVANFSGCPAENPED